VTRTAELEQNIRILKAEVEELKRKVEDLERDAKPQRRPGDSLRSRGWFKEILSEQFGIREDSGAGAS
jgi:FtsZ-binding cell division protein ZapB